VQLSLLFCYRSRILHELRHYTPEPLDGRRLRSSVALQLAPHTCDQTLSTPELHLPVLFSYRTSPLGVASRKQSLEICCRNSSSWFSDWTSRGGGGSWPATSESAMQWQLGCRPHYHHLNSARNPANLSRNIARLHRQALLRAAVTAVTAKAAVSCRCSSGVEFADAFHITQYTLHITIEITKILHAVRQLKFHEQKLLKKVDFLQWKNEANLRELQVRK